MIATEILSALGSVLGAVIAAVIAANRSGNKAARRTSEVFDAHDVKDRSDFLELKRALFVMQRELSNQLDSDVDLAGSLRELKERNEQVHARLLAEIERLRRDRDRPDFDGH